MNASVYNLCKYHVFCLSPLQLQSLLLLLADPNCHPFPFRCNLTVHARTHARTHALTFPAGSSLDEDDRRLLQLRGPVADALQLADVPVGHAVAAAHRLGAAAHAHAGLAPPPHRGGHLHAVGHRALHALCAVLVAGAAALLAFAGRAHRAAVAAVQHVTGQAVRGDLRALGLVASLRTVDGEALGDARLGQQAGGGEHRRYARKKQKLHDRDCRNRNQETWRRMLQSVPNKFYVTELCGAHSTFTCRTNRRSGKLSPAAPVYTSDGIKPGGDWWR